MEDARRGAFHVVAVAAFDRFAPSVKHLVLALHEFRSLGIQFVSLPETIDTRTPSARPCSLLLRPWPRWSLPSSASEPPPPWNTPTTVLAAARPIGRKKTVFRRDLALPAPPAGKTLSPDSCCAEHFRCRPARGARGISTGLFGKALAASPARAWKFRRETDAMLFKKGNGC